LILLKLALPVQQEAQAQLALREVPVQPEQQAQQAQQELLA
jgi:hypothetical protein